MSNLALLSGVIAISAFAFLIAIPWMFQVLCLYSMHTVRDSVYEIGRRHPRIAQTRIYQDVVFIHTNAIHLTREHGALECIVFFYASRRTPESAEKSWRTEVYARELEQAFSGADELATFERLAGSVSTTEGLVAIRIATAHPVLTLVFLLSGAVMGAKWLYALAAANPKPPSNGTQKIARSVGLRSGWGAPTSAFR